MSKIQIYNSDLELIKEFDKVIAAAAYLETHQSTVSRILTGQIRKHHSSCLIKGFYITRDNDSSTIKRQKNYTLKSVERIIEKIKHYEDQIKKQKDELSKFSKFMQLIKRKGANEDTNINSSNSIDSYLVD